MLLVRKLHSPKTKSNQWFTVMFVWQPNIPLSHMLNKSLWQKNVLKIFNDNGNRLVAMGDNGAVWYRELAGTTWAAGSGASGNMLGMIRAQNIYTAVGAAGASNHAY